MPPPMARHRFGLARTTRGVTRRRSDLKDQRTTRAIADDSDIDDKVRSLTDFVVPDADLPSGLKLLGGAHMAKMITPFARLSVLQRKAEACLKVKSEPSDFNNAASVIADLKGNIERAAEVAASLSEVIRRNSSRWSCPSWLATARRCATPC